MSTSVVRKKWGMGPSDVANRLAIVLRICVKGTSWYGSPPRVTTGEGGAGGGTSRCGAGCATTARASRSRLVTRPPGPVPVTSLRSTPASFAIRLASGEAFTRVASAGTAAEGTAPSSPLPGAGAGAGLGTIAGAAPTGSPGAAMTATTLPTATV